LELHDDPQHHLWRLPPCSSGASYVTPGGRRIVTELMGIRHEWLTRAIERDLTRAEGEMLTIVAALMQRIASSH
jgi:hypothetical protein